MGKVILDTRMSLDGFVTASNVAPTSRWAKAERSPTSGYSARAIETAAATHLRYRIVE